MARGKKKDEILLQDLMGKAKELNIEVRAERLMREVGYHVHSGRCRLRGKEVLLLDRDAPLSDQVEFLAAELDEKKE
jgi:hypothetical protein